MPGAPENLSGPRAPKPLSAERCCVSTIPSPVPGCLAGTPRPEPVAAAQRVLRLGRRATRFYVRPKTSTAQVPDAGAQRGRLSRWPDRVASLAPPRRVKSARSSQVSLTGSGARGILPGHPPEGQPHSSFGQAINPQSHGDYGKARPPDGELTFPVQTKATVLLAADARVTQRSRLGAAPSSEAHTDCQQRFVLPARRYEARSLILVSTITRIPQLRS